jgi:hypothetical protein
MTGHLIHIGFPKGASKLLQLWFEGHPQLAFCQWGIAGFRSALDIVDAANEPPRDIRYRVTSAEGLSAPPPKSGSARVDYKLPSLPVRELQANACGLLASLSPHAHILIVTRGFRSMILSSYSQYVRSGGSDDIETLLQRPDTGSPWHYDFVIGLYRQAFGDDKVLVLPYELLRDDREAFAGRIQDWLRLDRHPLPGARPNASLSPIELRWYPRLTRTLSKLPLGAALRRRLLDLHVAGAMENRWRFAIALLQRARPAPPATAEIIPDEVLARFRGQADSLGVDPSYARYAREYLFQGSHDGVSRKTP